MQTLSTICLSLLSVYLLSVSLASISLASVYIYLSIGLSVYLSAYHLSIIISLASIYIYLSVYLSISALILSLTSIENFNMYTTSVELNLLFCLAIHSFTHSSLTSHLLSLYYMEVPCCCCC